MPCHMPTAVLDGQVEIRGPAPVRGRSRLPGAAGPAVRSPPDTHHKPIIRSKKMQVKTKLSAGNSPQLVNIG